MQIKHAVLSIEAKGRGGYYTLPDLKNSTCPMKATFHNNIIALLFIRNISPFLKVFHRFTFNGFLLTKNNTGFFGHQFNNLQRAAFLT